MDRLSDLRKMDTREIIRDLVNWIDGTDPGWSSLEPMERRELLGRARLYFEEVARRHRISESDFMTPLEDAVGAVLREHAS